MNDKASQKNPRQIAAVDLGSNSFHMVVARIVGQELQIISRHKQQVRLGAGLNKHRRLSKEAIDRAIECLAMFAERIEGFSQENVKAAATFTLREAVNSLEFLQQAKAVFPYPIEIISGDEEARLIYYGVSHTLPNKEQKLVIDIGGGSTELIIGKDFDALLTCSKKMGCVSYNQRFFANGLISKAQFEKAQLASEIKLESMVPKYQKKGWNKVYGSSGTIRNISEILIAQGFEDGIITRKRLNKLIEEIVSVEHFKELSIVGLAIDRKPLFAAGVAILSGIFNALRIDKMHYSTAALREGLLYQTEDKLKHHDIRLRTTTNIAERYVIDLKHASRVQHSAIQFFQQSLTNSLSNRIKKRNAELKELLHWAALLHEVGLSIAHGGFHKHSAYILQHTTMPGFNQEQQQILATLTRFHRKSLKLKEIPEFTLYKAKHIHSLIRALRLACVLNIRRTNNKIPEITVKAVNDSWTLIFPAHWLTQNRLLVAALQVEKDIWQEVGWRLSIKTSK